MENVKNSLLGLNNFSWNETLIKFLPIERILLNLNFKYRFLWDFIHNIMINPKYPHYSKLKKYLTKEHLEIYKSLTQKFSYYDYFDNSQLNIIKNSRKSLVFSYKNLLIKVCFVRTSSSREIYFSHLFYPIEIFAFIVNEKKLFI